MSGFTTNFQIEFLAPGEPLRNTRAIMQRNAESLDAALTRGGVAPPAAQDLVAVAGRVTALENGAWQALTLAQGTQFSGWPPPRCRREGPDKLRIQLSVSGPVSPGPAVVTLPAGLRPVYNQAIPAVTGSTSAALGQVAPTGAVIIGASIASGGFLLIHGVITLT